MGFSSYLESRTLFPRRDGSRSTHEWALSSCSSSNDELDAQNVQPHQTTIKRKKSPHLESVYLPVLCVMPSKAWTWAKKEACGSSEWLHVRRIETTEGQKDGGIGGTKWLTTDNRMADCSTLPTRITKLKCVSSDIARSPFTSKKNGSLNWVHSTMSQPPWKSQ